MLKYSDLNPFYKAFVFELDDVLYPHKDYLLQVYYLFANFLEYTETFPPATDLTEFLKKAYENGGEEGLFDKAKEVFGIDEKYRENFERLHNKARLPLKLILFEQAKTFLNNIIADNKLIIIVTAGSPEVQLNKLGQIEWDTLAPHIRVYFADEFAPKPSPEVMHHVLKELNLQSKEVLVLGNTALDASLAKNVSIDFQLADFL